MPIAAADFAKHVFPTVGVPLVHEARARHQADVLTDFLEGMPDAMRVLHRELEHLRKMVPELVVETESERRQILVLARLFGMTVREIDEIVDLLGAYTRPEASASAAILMEIAEGAEDIAETLALAGSESFRDAVELELASVLTHD
jgi:hypothetical protein